MIYSHPGALSSYDKVECEYSLRGQKKGKEDKPETLTLLSPDSELRKQCESEEEVRKITLQIHDLLPDFVKDIAEIVKRSFGIQNDRCASLPLNLSCPVIFANNSLLLDSGAYNGYFPETYDAFKDFCKFLVTIKSKRKGFCDTHISKVEYGWTCAKVAKHFFETRKAQQGLQVAIDKDDAPFFTDLRAQIDSKVYGHLGDVRDNDERATAAFCEGKAAFLLQDSREYPLLADRVAFEIAVYPIPEFIKGKRFAIPLDGGILWVLDQTKAKTEAVRANLCTLARPKRQIERAMRSGTIPLTQTALKQLKERNEYANRYAKCTPFTKSVRTIIQQTVDCSVSPNFAKVRFSDPLFVQKGIDAILASKEDPTPMLGELQKQMVENVAASQPDRSRELYQLDVAATVTKKKTH